MDQTPHKLYFEFLVRLSEAEKEIATLCLRSRVPGSTVMWPTDHWAAGAALEAAESIEKQGSLGIAEASTAAVGALLDLLSYYRFADDAAENGVFPNPMDAVTVAPLWNRVAATKARFELLVHESLSPVDRN